MKISLFIVCLISAMAQKVLAQQNIPDFDHSLLLETKSDTTANVSFGDFDGDGHLDILLVKGRHWPIVDRVLLGDGKGGIRKAYNLGAIADRSYTGGLADFNGDGLPDIVTIDEFKGVNLYFGQKDQTFSAGISLADSKIVPYALAIADLNNDKKMDIIVGHIEAPSTVFLNDGTGRNFKSISFDDSKGTVYGFAVGDFNEDGIPDIAAARSDAPNVLYFGNIKSKSRK
jgi:hypothetical protein